jgi:8-oxo-dGTP pyrophosphatase MutT (NUDIX family)
VSSNPEVTVAAVVEHDGRFLVVEERIAGSLVFNQPAGHLEDGETLLEAAVREAREETAWRFKPEAMVGTYLWRNPDTGRSYLRFAFCGTVDDHQPQQPLDRGIVRALWLRPEQLRARPQRLRSPLVLRCIDDYLLGQRQPLGSVACLGLDTVLDACPVEPVAVAGR